MELLVLLLAVVFLIVVTFEAELGIASCGFFFPCSMTYYEPMMEGFLFEKDDNFAVVSFPFEEVV